MIDIFFQKDDGTLVKTLIHEPEGRRFDVNLVLKNETKTEAGFIKVEVDFQRSRRLELVDTKPMKIFQKHQYSRFWKANTAKQTRLQALFNGGQDFVLFPEDAESIGRFVICVLDIEQEEIIIPYCIRAQGLEKRAGKLSILAKKPLTEEKMELKILKEILRHDPGNEYVRMKTTVCLCGGSNIHGHRKDCPWPLYDINDEIVMAAWQKAREEKWVLPCQYCDKDVKVSFDEFHHGCSVTCQDCQPP